MLCMGLAMERFYGFYVSISVDLLKEIDACHFEMGTLRIRNDDEGARGSRSDDGYVIRESDLLSLPLGGVGRAYLPRPRAASQLLSFSASHSSAGQAVARVLCSTRVIYEKTSRNCGK